MRQIIYLNHACITYTHETKYGISTFVYHNYCYTFKVSVAWMQQQRVAILKKKDMGKRESQNNILEIASVLIIYLYIYLVYACRCREIRRLV